MLLSSPSRNGSFHNEKYSSVAGSPSELSRNRSANSTNIVPELMNGVLTRLLASGLPRIHEALHRNDISFIDKYLSAISSDTTEKTHRTIHELLSQCTWMGDFHYDYEARRICKDYV